MVVGSAEIRAEVATTLSARGIAVVDVPAVPVIPVNDEVLANARRAFDELDATGALRRLEQWLSEIDAGRVQTSRAALIDGLVLMYRARSALRIPHASEALRRVRAIDPTLVLPPSQYPPSVREALASIPVAEVHEIELHGPDGLVVRVDGGPPIRGIALVTLGEHVIEARAPGHRTRLGRMVLTPVTTLELPRDELAPLRDANRLTPSVRNAAARLGALPVVVGRTPSFAWAHDGALGRVRVRRGDGEGSRLVAALLASRAVNETLEEERPPRARRAILGAAGAVVAGLAVTFIALAVRGEPNTWEARYQP